MLLGHLVDSDFFARVKKTAPPPPPCSSVEAMYHSGDDCAINELLEGRMDLDVILPDSRRVRMTVERRTPMMDLLVQATTMNKISPGGHVIHIWADRGKDFVHYKPSTPIGSLDTSTIYIVPKSAVIDPPVKRLPRLANQPFEQTFRLQVNLPRNQLMVLRISPRSPLSEVKYIVCTEKQLDPFRYQLVRPNNPSQVLDTAVTLAEYGSTEITIMSVANIQASICNSHSDIIPYSASEKKGILGMVTNKKESSIESSEDPADCGMIPPKSDCVLNALAIPSTRIGSKKRQAPPPPSAPIVNNPNVANGNIYLPEHVEEDNEIVSHSRHSSDSSGYHEASVFSDCLESTSPETSSGSSVESPLYRCVGTEGIQQATNGPTNTKDKPTLICITSSTTAKKRRAPPPPSAQISERKSESDVVSSKMSTIITLNSKDQQLSLSQKCVRDNEMEENQRNDSIAEKSSSLKIRIAAGPKSDSELDKMHCTDIGEAIYLSDKDELKIPEIKHKRSESISSVGTLDDIQNSFDQTIAEAERVLWMESMEACSSPFDDNTAIADIQLAALSARIEQDVTKQEIISNIEAAFHTVEEESPDILPTPFPSPDEEDSVIDWHYTIPNPPSPFKNEESFQFFPKTECSVDSALPSLVCIQQKKELNESSVKLARVGNQESTFSNMPESDSQYNLQNFSIGFYCNRPRSADYLIEEDKANAINCPEEPKKNDSTSKLTRSESFNDLTKVKSTAKKGKYGGPGIRIRSFLDRNRKILAADDIKVYGVEGSVRGIKGQVRLRCTELADWSGSLLIKNRSSSLLNLSPEKKHEDGEEKKIKPQHSTSEKSNLKRTQSEQSLKNTGLAQEKSEFAMEQERLQNEYLKLQKQFLVWQQQLISNQTILQKEQIMPSSLLSNLPGFENHIMVSNDIVPPRTFYDIPSSHQQIKKAVAIVQPEIHQSLKFKKEPNDLNNVCNNELKKYARRQSRKAERNQFLKDEEEEESEANTSQDSIESRNSIDIPFTDFESNNTSAITRSLRSSTSKTHFKPPQIRSSSKSRQRLPPEIRSEEESTAESLLSKLQKELKTATQKKSLPDDTNESNNNRNDPFLWNENYLSNKKMTTLNNKINNDIKNINLITNEIISSNSKSITKQFVNSEEKHTADVSSSLLPYVEAQKSKRKSNSNKREMRPEVKLDPREELMLEVRNFGGRQALKKVSLDFTPWTLTVNGTST